jgi:hypothetical protein
MNCYLSGILGLGMIMASLSTMSISAKESKIFKNVLNPTLKKTYDKISLERKRNYLYGLILGLIVSKIAIGFINITNKYHRMNICLAITLIITISYYSLIPKSDYMLKHLRTSKENKAWLKIYSVMKQRYILGFILGSLSSVPISYIFC